MALPKITIVNYGVGNLLSAARALAFVGAEVRMTEDPDDLSSADRVLLPGVGAFGHCMESLQARGFVPALQAFAKSGRPFLGICVGMQVLFDESEEFGPVAGLSLIGGAVRRIPLNDASGKPQKVPHIGWSALTPAPEARHVWQDSFLSDVARGDAAYFVHSYTAWPDDDADRLADAWHGGQRVCAVTMRDNIVGVQFHPEKSGQAGLVMLQRFMRI